MQTCLLCECPIEWDENLAGWFHTDPLIDHDAVATWEMPDHLSCDADEPTILPAHIDGGGSGE